VVPKSSKHKVRVRVRVSNVRVRVRVGIRFRRASRSSVAWMPQARGPLVIISALSFSAEPTAEPSR